MLRLCHPLSIGLVLVAAAAVADDKPASSAGDAAAAIRQDPAALAKLLNNPDDLPVLKAFIGDANREVIDLNYFYGDSAAAERRLKEFETAVARITPTTPEAVREITTAKNNIIPSMARMIESNRETLADLEKAVGDKPNDNDSFRRWMMKFRSAFDEQARSDPDKAAKMLAAANALVAKVGEQTTNTDVRRNVTFLQNSSRQLNERALESGRKLAALVGTEPPPLDVQSWVNTAPCTLAALKGKVVLLDISFLTRHCPPIVAHVRQWHTKFAEKGLAVVGLTRTSGYVWDDTSRRLVPSARGVVLTTTQQQEALQSFADFHQLKYPLAIRSPNDRNFDFGLLAGSIVVIDQAGKVRKIWVSPNERETRDIDKLLTELLTLPNGQ